jgi:hypothetical protein
MATARYVSDRGDTEVHRHEAADGMPPTAGISRVVMLDIGGHRPTTTNAARGMLSRRAKSSASKSDTSIRRRARTRTR